MVIMTNYSSDITTTLFLHDLGRNEFEPRRATITRTRKAQPNPITAYGYGELERLAQWLNGGARHEYPLLSAVRYLAFRSGRPYIEPVREATDGILVFHEDGWLDAVHQVIKTPIKGGYVIEESASGIRIAESMYQDDAIILALGLARVFALSQSEGLIAGFPRGWEHSLEPMRLVWLPRQDAEENEGVPLYLIQASS